MSKLLSKYIPQPMERDTTATIDCNSDLKTRVGKHLKKRGIKWVDWFEGMLRATLEEAPRGDIKLKRR